MHQQSGPRLDQLSVQPKPLPREKQAIAGNRAAGFDWWQLAVLGAHLVDNFLLIALSTDNAAKRTSWHAVRERLQQVCPVAVVSGPPLPPGSVPAAKRRAAVHSISSSRLIAA
ncbi:hypothetical protein ABPG75_012258 [Micractinium tetrahymenae]